MGTAFSCHLLLCPQLRVFWEIQQGRIYQNVSAFPSTFPHRDDLKPSAFYYHQI